MENQVERATIFQSPFLPALLHYAIHDSIADVRELKGLLKTSPAIKSQFGAVETARRVCRGEVLCLLEYDSKLLLFPSAASIVFKQFVYAARRTGKHEEGGGDDDMVVVESVVERRPLGSRFTVCIAIANIRAHTLLFKSALGPVGDGVLRSLGDILFEDTRRFGRFLLDNEGTLRGDDKEAQFGTYLEAIELTRSTKSQEIPLPGLFLVPHWLDDELRLFSDSRLLCDVSLLRGRLARLDHGLLLSRSTIPNGGNGVFTESDRAFEPDQMVTFFSGHVVRHNSSVSHFHQQHYRIAFSHELVLLGDRRESDGKLLFQQQHGTDEKAGLGGGAFINDSLNVGKLRAQLARQYHRLTRCDTEAKENQHRGKQVNVTTQRIDDVHNLLRKVNRQPIEAAHRLLVVVATQHIEPETELFLSYGPEYWRESMSLHIDLCDDSDDDVVAV